MGSFSFFAFIPSIEMLCIIGFSTTKTFKVLSDISIFTSSKKLVSYKFFKILFNVLSENSSLMSISPNIIIVSFEILTFYSNIRSIEIRFKFTFSSSKS